MGGRRQALIGAALALVVLSACGSDRTATPVPVSPPTTPVATTAPPTTLAVPPTTRLPRPVGIPADSYTREKIVEFGSIEIPAIDLQHTLFQGVTLHNIDLGPSHWTGTAWPGQRGNTVIAGHRVTHTRPFERIDELQAGDEVIFRVAGQRSVYHVTSHEVVTPDDTWIADQTPEHTGTLYACHPPGSVAYRYVVRMKMASTGPETESP